MSVSIKDALSEQHNLAHVR